MQTGIIGGRLGYQLLRWLGARAQRTDTCSGSPYRTRSKVETLFGPEMWSALVDKVVIDFGCGTGAEAIEVAQRVIPEVTTCVRCQEGFGWNPSGCGTSATSLVVPSPASAQMILGSGPIARSGNFRGSIPVFT